jgi:hypothetical protein
MNDFTKDELKKLYDGLYFEGWREDIKENPHYLLIKKIQSMIDNYCEHDFHPVIGSFQIESYHKCMKVK